MIETHTHNVPSLQYTMRGVVADTSISADSQRRLPQYSSACCCTGTGTCVQTQCSKHLHLSVYVSRSFTILSLLYPLSHYVQICATCTRLQASYAHKLDIPTLICTPTINTSHYMSKETLSREEIHMFETRTHKQCLPYCRT